MKSEASRQRGYGSYCYSKLGADAKKDYDPEIETQEQEEQLDGQMDILEEVKTMIKQNKEDVNEATSKQHD